MWVDAWHIFYASDSDKFTSLVHSIADDTQILQNSNPQCRYTSTLQQVFFQVTQILLINKKTLIQFIAYL